MQVKRLITNDPLAPTRYAVRVDPARDAYEIVTGREGVIDFYVAHLGGNPAREFAAVIAANLALICTRRPAYWITAAELFD